MSLSQTALQAVLAQATNQTFLRCLTITHADLASDILLVDDNQDLERTAGTFVAFPFDVRPATQNKNQLPKLHITIDNVDQRIVTQLRALAGTRDDITISYEVVLADSPNTIEFGPISFRVDTANFFLTTITFELSYHFGFLDNAFPSGQFAPSNAG